MESNNLYLIHLLQTLISSTIFGANLTQEGICSVNQLIEFITKDNNIINEGIFRKSGSSSRQKDLQNLISLGITVNLEANRYTVHDCCSVLKKFISELPEPLLTEPHFELIVKIFNLKQSISSPNKVYTKKLNAIQLLLLLIPAANRQLLHELLSLFQKVLKYSNLNKMSSSSLATIFAPHLFCPKNFTAIELQQNLNVITNTLVFMIDNSMDVFKAPNELIIDINKQMETLSKSSSTNSLAPISSVYNFCVQENDTNSEDFTSKQVAELYAYIHNMPNSGTPQKKKWIKRFNRENGNGTPLLKHKKLDSSKKLKNSIGDVLKAGQVFLFGSSVTNNNSKEMTKHNKDLNKNLFKDYDKKTVITDQIYNRFSADVNDYNLKSSDNSSIDSYKKDELNTDCLTPLGITLDNANKRVRISVRKVGNREPLVM